VNSVECREKKEEIYISLINRAVCGQIIYGGCELGRWGTHIL
jgi:hypothetical protein